MSLLYVRGEIALSLKCDTLPCDAAVCKDVLGQLNMIRESWVGIGRWPNRGEKS